MWAPEKRHCHDRCVEEQQDRYHGGPGEHGERHRADEDQREEQRLRRDEAGDLVGDVPLFQRDREGAAIERPRLLAGNPAPAVEERVEAKVVVEVPGRSSRVRGRAALGRYSRS
jgi:hypothetical protein